MKNLFNKLHSEFNFNHKNYSFIFNAEKPENGENPQLAEALSDFEQLSMKQLKELLVQILGNLMPEQLEEKVADTLLTEKNATEAYQNGTMPQHLRPVYEEDTDPQKDKPVGNVMELQRRDITNYDAEYLKNFGEDTGLNKIGIKTLSKKVANDFILDLQPEKETDKLEWTLDGKEIDTPRNITAENLSKIEREEPGDYADIYIDGQIKPFRVRAVPKNPAELNKIDCTTKKCNLARKAKIERVNELSEKMQEIKDKGYKWTSEAEKTRLTRNVLSSKHVEFPPIAYLEKKGYIQKTSE